MQRSHDTLAFGIWTKNWCLESEHGMHHWLTTWGSLPQRLHPRLRLSRSLETYECCHHPYQPQPGNSIKISSGRASFHLRLWQCQPALNDARCKLQRQIGRNQVWYRPSLWKTYRSQKKNLVALACSTKRAKCMTLSVLETSLPMQRSHDTLAFGIWTKNWCLESERGMHHWLTAWGSLPQRLHHVMIKVFNIYIWHRNGLQFQKVQFSEEMHQFYFFVYWWPCMLLSVVNDQGCPVFL